MPAEALGYVGPARFVAFRWTPYIDEVRWTDGRTSMGGSAQAWLTFTEHPAVAPHLFDYNFGNSDTEAEHSLLLDRETQALYAGTQRDVEIVLKSVWQETRELTPISRLLKLDTAEDFFEQIADGDPLGGFVEITPPSNEAVLAAVRRASELNSQLRRWLDEYGEQAARN